MSASQFYSYPIPDAVLDGFYSDPAKRTRILSAISYGPERDHRMRWISPATRMLNRNHAIVHADKVFFEAMRKETMAMREAAASAAEDAGHPDLALVIRGQKIPEWGGL